MIGWFKAFRDRVRARADATKAAVTAEADRLVRETGSDHLAYRKAREIVRDLDSSRAGSKAVTFAVRVRDELRIRWCGYLPGADTATRMLYRDELR